MRSRLSVRMLSALLALAVVAAACGDDSSESSDEPAEEPAATEEPTTSAPTTTAAIPEGGESIEGLQLSAVVFGDGGHATITNTSDADITLDGLWLCNRPAYVALSGALAPGDSVDIASSDLGGLRAEGGEVGLYSSSSFDSSDDMVDYVQWGNGGGRASVAVGAGLWPEGITVTPTADLIELLGVPGDPESWS